MGDVKVTENAKNTNVVKVKVDNKKKDKKKEDVDASLRYKLGDYIDFNTMFPQYKKENKKG